MFILVMSIHFGVSKIMKKIIILLALLLAGSCFSPYRLSACPINSPGACKADISTGTGGLKNKIMPNNLENLTRPNSTMEIRQETMQPQIPSTINTESRPQTTQQGYDANCQFGNCLNKTPESEVSR